MIHDLTFGALADQIGVGQRQARRLAKKHCCHVIKFHGYGSRVRVSDYVLEAMRRDATGRRWQTMRAAAPATPEERLKATKTMREHERSLADALRKAELHRGRLSAPSVVTNLTFDNGRGENQ